MSRIGFVYILSNPSMPGLLKIGMTTRAPSLRMLEISASTGVPNPFEMTYYAEVECPDIVERDMHMSLQAYRINPDREFFKVSDDFAINTVRQVADILSEFISSDILYRNWCKRNARSEAVSLVEVPA